MTLSSFLTNLIYLNKLVGMIIRSRFMADFVSVDRFPYYRNLSRKYLPLIHQGLAVIFL